MGDEHPRLASGRLGVGDVDDNLHKPQQGVSEAVVALVLGGAQGHSGDLPFGARFCELPAVVSVLVKHVQDGAILGFQGRSAGDLNQLDRLRKAFGSGDLLHGQRHTPF